MSALTLHPITSLFPRMTGDEYEALRDDIWANGVLEPIWTWQGQVIDGRHRFLACQDLGIDPPAREWSGQGSLSAFVVSLNLHRRHLSESQRAMVAASLATLGQGRPGKAANLPVLGVTQADAADLLSVSERSVRSAVRVRADGVPELVDAVQAGGLTVSAAAEIARLPEPEQRERLSDAQLLLQSKAVEYYTPVPYIVRKRGQAMKQHRSAASARQARWRESTELRRVEMYLLPKAVEWLDELAREHGTSGRAVVVEHLIGGKLLPPLLVDVRRELLKAYQALLQAATYRRAWAVDVRSILDKAMQQLEQCGA